MVLTAHAMAVLLGLALAGAVLWSQLWRVWLFVWPGSVRLRPSSAPLPSALIPMADQLAALGFSPIGAHVEQPRFGRARTAFDFAHPGGTFATAFLPAGPGGKPRLQLLTRREDGGLVLSADHLRIGARPGEGYACGGMPGWPPSRLYLAHVSRCAPARSPESSTLEARLAVGTAWYAGPGATEIRRRHLSGLLWSLATVGMVAWFFAR